ncbi:MAG: crossover junction endodeoxyribonuclease RuvC [Actinomycetota bacterium]
MRVLGVDPGLTRCGIGVIQGNLGSPLSLVEVGTILTSPDAPLEERLLRLEEQFLSWIARCNPDVIAIERVFSQLNVKTVMGTSQASGIALLVAAKSGIPVFMHTPTEVKASVTGSGRASKAQVAEMVRRLLGLDSIPKPVDSTDALALAICHVWRGPTVERLQSAAKEEQQRIKNLKRARST